MPRKGCPGPNDVLPAMCGTCPFREGSPYAHLAADLATAAITTGNRICHNTGSGNAINRRTGRPAKLCRGARDFQLRHFHRAGLLKEPTDACWAQTLEEAKAATAGKK